MSHRDVSAPDRARPQPRAALDIGFERGFRGRILASRLGKCWKCMTLSVLLFVSSVALVFYLPGLREGKADDALFAGAVVAALLFGLLTLAHLVTFVLRKTAWAPATIDVFDRRVRRGD